MSYIGIDCGTSNIKIVETDKNLNIKNKKTYNKSNIAEAVLDFMKCYNINIKEVENIAVTGVGADKEEKILGLETTYVSEFVAIGNVGKTLLPNKDFIIASAGTGTAFIKKHEETISHVGGTGIGGGTLINLCKQVDKNITFDKINKIVKTAKLTDVDLTIQDVATEEIETLPPDTTAVNFGKLNEKATNDDIILGILNMVFETIGTISAIIAKENKIEYIIAIGKTATIPYARDVFNKIEKLHKVKFIIPENAEYVTALGAIMGL